MNPITPYHPPTYAAIERADLSPATQRQYIRALALMAQANVNPFDFDALTTYAATLKTSARGFLKAALAIMLSDLLIRAQAGANVANLEKIQVLWHRVQAMNQAIQTYQPDAKRTPHWLTQAQIDTIMQHAQASQRDTVVLALLINGLLRRDELVNLTFDALSQLDGKDVLTVRGKGSKVRRVPLPASLAQYLHKWEAVTGGGLIARAIDRHGNIQGSLSASGVYNIVRKYGNIISIPDLEPHDLRRTGARIMYNATKDILKVQNILGHSDSKTSLIYIGVQIDLDAVQIVKE